MYIGQIIDAHMHIWDLANGQKWLSVIADGALHFNFSMKDYLEMSRNQPISQMIYIECGAFPHDPILETKWVQKQADLYGGPQGIIGFAKLDESNVEDMLKKHLQYPNFRGIRMSLNFVAGSFGAERDDYMQDPAWRNGYSLLSKYSLPFEMQIFDSQIPDACIIARDFPDTPLILEHLGWPRNPDLDHLHEWKNKLEELAHYPNVFLKLSCLGWIFQKNEPTIILPYLKEAIKVFGIDRCMVGSNCPPDKIFLSFDEIFHLFRLALSSYSPLDQQKVFYSNAKRIYRL